MSRISRPRALLRLTVPLPSGDGYEPFTYDVEVSRARLELNDHNHADALDVDVDWIDAGVDPRWIAGATCEFYMDNADDFGAWEPTEDNLRFVGRMVRPRREATAESLKVSLSFHDYTSFFLVAKPVASAAIPRYSDTLQDAWVRLCNEVPGCEALADNLVFRGLDAGGVKSIGSAVAARFRNFGSMPIKPGIDAWAVWQQAAGMMGLLSFFEKDQCIVTTASDYYTGGDTPKLVWGRNLLSFSESRNNDREARGVGITSFDPLTGTALEAIYDPLAGKRKPKKPAAKVRHRKKPKAPKFITKSEVDFFPFPGVTDPDRLMEIAKRVYEERIRGELEGNAVTVDMTAETASADEMDLLSIRQGDTIEVRFLDSDDADFVKRFSSKQDRIDYLVTQRGYRSEVAQVVASNVDSMTDKSSLFFVKAANVELESTEEGGSFKLSIDFMNKIDPAGGSAGASITS
jgi:hypothetical protein